LIIFGIAGCRMTDVPLWGPTPTTEATTFEVEQVRDVVYCDGLDTDDHRHRLDLFLPKGLKDYPVVVLIHGGAWLIGDNRCCGLYPAVAEFLASQGIAVALPNYRLSPGVQHPEHIKDVARAVAWTHAHIADYGGCPDKLFVGGHSAGGHLAALLATHPNYLQAEGLAATDIKGVIAVSGVYRIPEGSLHFTLGGSTSLALRLDEMYPVRSASSWRGPLATVPGIPLQFNLFGPVFSNEADVREDASPLSHVRPGLPPFLILCAARDLPTLPENAEEFYRALCAQGCEAHFLRVEDRNHNSAFFRATEPADPAAAALVDFIWQHVSPGVLLAAE
jgi:acetyl esterase/lipase